MASEPLEEASMESQHHHRHSIVCIIPPHIFEELAKNGDPGERVLAVQMLGADATKRSARMVAQVLQAAAPQAAAPAAAPHRLRRIYNLNHGTTLPGTLVRSEGQAASGDA